MAMIVLIFVSFGLRVLWLDQPDKSLIFDEKYYVSAALTILDMPQPADAPYAHSTPGKDGNPEHPALAKLIMAAGIALDGDNPWGWRFPSVLAGTLSIVFVYKVARAVGLSAWPAVLAAYLYSFDNLVFITSRIGILDIYMMLGLLAGAALFLMNRPVWAGVLFAFGTLCKEGGVYGPAIVGIFAVLVTLVRWAGWHVAFRRALFTTVMAVVFVAVTLGGLWQIDLRWSTFTNPIDHVTHIWDYGTHLTKAAGPSGIESYPWEWLLNEVQIPYLKVTVTICGKAIPNNGPCLPTDVLRQYDSILFRGAMNPFLLFVLPLAGAFAIAQLRAKRSATALFSLVWFGLAYLPYIPLSVLDHRIEYFYYIFTAIPAIAIATAALFSDPRIPKSVTVGFVIGILYGFAGYFPFSGFKV
jgi:4-amino-4-deoxy-L-arabinose transferase-like glycosyltransferase